MKYFIYYLEINFYERSDKAYKMKLIILSVSILISSSKEYIQLTRIIKN